jgi:epoxyqueuosine reductase QueG
MEMAPLDDHPTVIAVRGRSPQPRTNAAIDAAWLRQVCLDAGADDVGFVEIERPELAEEREHVLALFPETKTLVSIVCRMNREPVRRVQRSVANAEFHHVGHDVNEVAHRVVKELENKGLRAVNPPMAFPMEADRWPDRTWVVSHKPVAVAAGLGMMGIHRNVIHPKFGNFILLGTVLLESIVSEHSEPTSYNPCLECKLCVAACPVGAIKPDGQFDLASCYTHNYREFMGGFGDWAEHLAEAKNGLDLRNRVTPAEQVSMWQSLAFGPNYKSGNCIAVCPAGEDVIGQYLADRGGFVNEVVKPLQQNTEAVYVVPNSDAEAHVSKRFPHKRVRRVRGSLLPSTVKGFLFGIGLSFQRDQSVGLNAIYHFTFTGSDSTQATVTIRDKSVDVRDGLLGTADCAVTADADIWLGFLRKEKSILWAILRRKVRVKGKLSLLTAFGKCFPT